MKLVRLFTASIFSISLGAILAPGAALASVAASTATLEGSSRTSPKEGIEIAFCFISSGEAAPNTTVYAPTRAEAERRAPRALMYCKDGPCTHDGEMEVVKEDCTP